MIAKFRTPAKEMTERLNVNYYKPEFIENQRKLESKNTIKFSQLYVEKGIGHTASVEPHYSKNGNGVPFISGKAIKDGKLLTDIAERILIESHCGVMEKSHLHSGYLLMVRKGDIGNTCIVPANVEELNCSSEVMFFKCKNIEQSCYLSAFFNSRHGRLSVERLQRGSLIPGVSLSDIPELNILWLSDEARSYIGHKVRQAERLRERSRELENKVNSFHAQFIPSQSSLDFKKKTHRVLCKNLTERLDSHFYPSVVEKYLKSIDCRHVALGDLAQSIFNGQTQQQLESVEGTKQATVANLSSTFLKKPYRSVLAPTNLNRYFKNHDLSICNAAHEKSYIGRFMTYCYIKEIEEVYPSTEVMVIRVDRSTVPASYIRSYLLTQVGYLQTQSTIRGITAHSYPSDVKLIRIPIPNVSNSQREYWLKTDE